MLHQLGVTDAAPAPAARAALAEFLAHNGGEVEGRASVPYAYSPVIDAARCTGCDDCVNVCPHNALTVIKVEDDGLV
ncbi:MAG TPA: 4Fe-4S dicluster domain-containing protein, partial [Aliiroseovarius sp.]|nr:4Fe-4S dicluster domain-containing protein [Aliiroseovarius sp.]